MPNVDLKLKIIEAAIDEFNDNGIKFTMDNIAKRLHISKKTIYTIFKDKETLLLEGVNHGFDLIKESENQVLNDASLNNIEKLKRVLIVLPDRFKNIDWRQIYAMQDSYPDIFNEIIERVNTGWEPTLELLNKGIDEGDIKPINTKVFKIMVESSIREFIGDTSLIQENISYEEALKDMIEILMGGISNER